MPGKLFALIVGINDYAPPVPALKGAVKDAEKLKSFIEESYPDKELRMKVLLNGEATYDRFIHEFRSHFADAGKDDVVWFHYSGHGSRQPGAPEFFERNSGGMDETLVLFDSRPAGRDLADKELAVLLSEVSARGPHLVVSLDCCHSGSGTRSAESGKNPAFITRLSDDRSDKRTLDTYLSGYFRDRGLKVPEAKHILLAACNRFQTAKESWSGSGVFTENLIETLKKSGREISYAELFVRLRQGVVALDWDQDPQFEPVSGFNGYGKFLDGSPIGRPGKFLVFAQEGKWLMEAGAIQGLKENPGAETEVRIYAENSDMKGEPLLTTKIASVMAQRSELTAVPGMDENARYWGVPSRFPDPPVTVSLGGDEKMLAPIRALLTKDERLSLVAATEPASFRITSENGKTELWDERRKKFLLGYMPAVESGPLLFQNYIDQVIRWQNLFHLENPNSKIAQASQSVLVVKQGQEVNEFGPGEIRLNVKAGEHLPVKMMVRNAFSQNLHFCLLYLSGDYGVIPLRNEMLEPSTSPFLMWGGGDDDYLHVPDGAKSSEDAFLLIVSSEKTDEFQLQMEELQTGETLTANTRAIPGIGKLRKVSGEWFSQRFRILLSAE